MQARAEDGGPYMPITRMNHAVLYVRDTRRTQRFYADVLGFSTVIEDAAGAYVFMRAPASANHHDIAFFSVGVDAEASRANPRGRCETVPQR